MEPTKALLADLAARYGAPIGAPENPTEAVDLAKSMLKSFGEFFVEDLMLGGSSELGDATLTGNQELLQGAARKANLFEQLMEHSNDRRRQTTRLGVEAH